MWKDVLWEPLTVSGFIVGKMGFPGYFGLKVCWLHFLPNNPPPCEPGLEVKI